MRHRHANVCVMSLDAEKVTVALDAELVTRAREELAADDVSDAAVIERALNAYLLGRLLDAAQMSSQIEPEEANRIAVEEVRASRRGRRHAA